MAQKSISDLRARILSALSDPTRLDILEYLSEGERCVCEIIPAFDRSQSTISKHLSILYEAGIVDRRIDGKRTLYRIKNERIFDLIKDVDAIALDYISELSHAGRTLEELKKADRPQGSPAAVR
ncbi:MAG: winged helix-turn-helix transcriptional regulator [Methanotrichaceae archaeon]|nr:winged helix-turn-helix transcriptional regulator [Methanotrichaceae archaeon]